MKPVRHEDREKGGSYPENEKCHLDVIANVSGGFERKLLTSRRARLWVREDYDSSVGPPVQRLQRDAFALMRRDFYAADSAVEVYRVADSKFLVGR